MFTHNLPTPAKPSQLEPFHFFNHTHAHTREGNREGERSRSKWIPLPSTKGYEADISGYCSTHLLSMQRPPLTPGQFEWSATNLVSHERTPILQSLAFEKSLAHENHDLDAEENGLWVPISPLTGTKRCLAVRTCWFVQATSYEMSHERWFVGWESSVRWTAFVSALLFIQNRLFLTHEYVFWMPSCYRCWNNQFLWCCWQLCIRSPRWTQKLGKSYSN